mgnify:FL=1
MAVKTKASASGKKSHKLSKHEWAQQARLLPAYIPLVLWLVFCVFAIGWLFAASLSTSREVFSDSVLHSGLHFENYVKAWRSNNVSRYFLHSLVYSTVPCAVLILLGAPAAYVLAKKQFKLRKAIITTFLVGMAVPGTMVLIPWYSLLIRWNMVGQLSTLLLIYCVSGVSGTVFFLVSFFSSVPSSLEEAAMIDGCTPYQAFWKIMFHMAQPGVITITIFNFLGYWNEYFLALIFANSSESVRSLAVGLQNMINSMRFTGDYASLYAAILIVFLPTFILYLFLSDKIIAGVTGGAVKG